jgi:uncharacterized protein (TIGR01244 family)
MQLKQLDDETMVAPQILPEEVPALAARGIMMIVNNRPDEEEPGQPSSAEVQAAANAAGIQYRHIPVGTSGLSSNQVDAMVEAIGASTGPLLAFCRSGTRSTYVWALARSRMGDDAAELDVKAAAAGYDLAPIRAFLSR